MKASPKRFLQFSALASQYPLCASKTNFPSFIRLSSFAAPAPRLAPHRQPPAKANSAGVLREPGGPADVAAGVDQQRLVAVHRLQPFERGRAHRDRGGGVGIRQAE